MTSLLERIAQDEADYLHNCQVYDESPRLKNGYTDIYGEHARTLAARAWQQQRGIDHASSGNEERP